MKKRRRSDRSVYVLCVCTLLCTYTHVNVHIRVQDLTAGCVFRKGGQQHEVSGHRGAVLTVSLQASAHTQTLWMIAVAHPGESLFLNTQPSFTLPSARLISLGHRPSPNIRLYHTLSASFKGTVHPKIKCIYFILVWSAAYPSRLFCDELHCLGDIRKLCCEQFHAGLHLFPLNYTHLFYCEWSVHVHVTQHDRSWTLRVCVHKL